MSVCLSAVCHRWMFYKNSLTYYCANNAIMIARYLCLFYNSMESTAVCKTKGIIQSSITAWQRDCCSRLQCCRLVGARLNCPSWKLRPLRCGLSSSFFEHLLSCKHAWNKIFPEPARLINDVKESHFIDVTAALIRPLSCVYTGLRPRILAPYVHTRYKIYANIRVFSPNVKYLKIRWNRFKKRYNALKYRYSDVIARL